MTSPDRSPDGDDLPDSLGSVGMDLAQVDALALIRAAGPPKTPARHRGAPAAGRPVAAPVYLDRHAAGLLQLHADVETARTGLTLQFVVGRLAIVAGVIALIVLVVS